jgi:hypothetical protein
MIDMENKAKRERFFINGYEWWIDVKNQNIYDTDTSKNDIPYDSDNETFVRSTHLTKNEAQQLLDYLKYKRL